MFSQNDKYSKGKNTMEDSNRNQTNGTRDTSKFGTKTLESSNDKIPTLGQIYLFN